MGADATLVAAAYRMGMANVPGDWSDSFDKMYEGIAAAHVAKAKMFGDIFECGIEAYGKYKKGQIEGDEEATDLSPFKSLVDKVYGDPTTRAMNDLVEKQSKQDIMEGNKTLSQGGPLPIEFFNRAEGDMQEIKDELEDLQRKPFLTRKDRKRRDELHRKAQDDKSKLLQNKALAKTLGEANASGQINWEVTRANDGEHAQEYGILRGKVINSNTNWEEEGIELFTGNGEPNQMGDGKTYEKGEWQIRFIPGRLGAAYFSNQKKKGNLVTIDPNTGQPNMGPKTYAESLTMTDPKTGEVINEPPQAQVVSFKRLMNVSLYDRETEAANMAEIAKASSFASETMADKETFQYTSFRDPNVPYDLRSQVHDNFVNNIRNSKVGAASTIQDLSSRTIRGKNYKNDLLTNPEITNATYESLGISIDLLAQADKNSDSVINKNEYGWLSEQTYFGQEETEDGKFKVVEKKYISDDLKAQIINKLTNPSTDEDIEIATKELANWWTNQAEVIFNNDRAKLLKTKNAKNKTKTTTRTTRGTQTERDRNRKYNTLSDKISGGEVFQLGGKNSAYQIDPQNGVILKKFINQAGEEETQQIDPQIFLDEYFGAGMYESGEVFSDTAFTQSPIGDETEEANEDFKNRDKKKKKKKKKGSVAGLNWLQRKMFGI